MWKSCEIKENEEFEESYSNLARKSDNCFRTKQDLKAIIRPQGFPNINFFVNFYSLNNRCFSIVSSRLLFVIFLKMSEYVSESTETNRHCKFNAEAVAVDWVKFELESPILMDSHSINLPLLLKDNVIENLSVPYSQITKIAVSFLWYFIYDFHGFSILVLRVTMDVFS